ncbi:MAG: tetratricopeptide repeat protein [Cyanobacteria bacterium J06576_12]
MFLVEERFAEGSSKESKLSFGETDSSRDFDGITIEAQTRALRAHQQGNELKEEGRWEEAIAYYQEAIRLMPEFSWAHHSLGDCHKRLGNAQGAITAYGKAIALNPGFVWS